MEAHKDRPPASETDRTLILETVISGIADPRRTARGNTVKEAKGILASAEPEALRESLTRCYELLRCGEYTTLKGLLSEHLTEFPEHKPEILAFARKLVSTDPTSDWFEIDSGHGMNLLAEFSEFVEDMELVLNGVRIDDMRAPYILVEAWESAWRIAGRVKQETLLTPVWQRVDEVANILQDIVDKIPKAEPDWNSNYSTSSESLEVFYATKLFQKGSIEEMKANILTKVTEQDGTKDAQDEFDLWAVRNTLTSRLTLLERLRNERQEPYQLELDV
jgi:hypothetical protein